jgi:hypothetical protein
MLPSDSCGQSLWQKSSFIGSDAASLLFSFPATIEKTSVDFKATILFLLTLIIS